MIDSELKEHLEKIDKRLIAILHKAESPWRAFINGMLRGLGSIVGIVLAVLITGWVLNAMGIIPGLKQQAGEWKTMWQDTLEQVKKIR